MGASRKTEALINNEILHSKHAGSYEFERLMEILWDYWLGQPDEDEVCIEMWFRKGKEAQLKRVNWRKPGKSNRGILEKKAIVWKQPNEVFRVLPESYEDRLRIFFKDTTFWQTYGTRMKRKDEK